MLNSIFNNVKNEPLKLLLFRNPSKENFWYKILSYLPIYPQLKRVEKIDKILNDLREFFYQTLLGKELTIEEINYMGMLSNENFEVLDFYNRAIYNKDQGQLVNIKSKIDEMNSDVAILNDKKDEIKKILDFLNPPKEDSYFLELGNFFKFDEYNNNQ